MPAVAASSRSTAVSMNRGGAGSRASRPMGWCDSATGQRNLRSSGSRDSLGCRRTSASERMVHAGRARRRGPPCRLPSRPRRAAPRARSAAAGRSRARAGPCASARTSRAACGTRPRAAPRARPASAGSGDACASQRSRLNPSRSTTPFSVFSALRPDPFFASKSTTGASTGSTETYSMAPSPSKKRPTTSSPARTGAARPDFSRHVEMPGRQPQARDRHGLADPQMIEALDDLRQRRARPRRAARDRRTRPASQDRRPREGASSVHSKGRHGHRIRQTPMTLQPGSRLGTYEIVDLLGVGGMGEVYRARDRKLGREVAIKVLPEEFARDPGRVARFEREARMLAAVNHPTIAAIYGAEQDGDDALHRHGARRGRDARAAPLDRGARPSPTRCASPRRSPRRSRWRTRRASSTGT